jgi:hypothetical protein
MGRVRNQQYKNNLELRGLIINCIAMKLSETDSLEYLKQKGYTCTVRTLRTQKHLIKSGRTQRLNQIVSFEFIDSHLEALDNLYHIKSEMWVNYHAETHPYRRTEILTQIANLEPYISEYMGLTKKIIENKTKRTVS